MNPVRVPASRMGIHRRHLIMNFPENSSSAVEPERLIQQNQSAGLPDAKVFLALTNQALELRWKGRYALHPAETALLHHRAEAEIIGEEGHGGLSLEQAEAHYRAGAQGLRLSEIPQLPRNLAGLSRLEIVDRAGRKALRKWVEDCGYVVDEAVFLRQWENQGRRGGAEHQVFHDQESSRWFKRLYSGINQSTLGDYLVRMRLHSVLFPETGYRLEGFTINAKSKALAPVVS